MPVPGNLADYRENGRNSPGGTYTAKISLLLRLYYLDTFVHSPISAGFLDMMQVDFDTIRAQGCKTVLRIAYNKDQTRPFDEPSKARILAHIAQLKPLLQKMPTSLPSCNRVSLGLGVRDITPMSSTPTTRPRP